MPVKRPAERDSVATQLIHNAGIRAGEVLAEANLQVLTTVVSDTIRIPEQIHKDDLLALATMTSRVFEHLERD